MGPKPSISSSRKGKEIASSSSSYRQPTIEPESEEPSPTRQELAIREPENRDNKTQTPAYMDGLTAYQLQQITQLVRQVIDDKLDAFTTQYGLTPVAIQVETKQEELERLDIREPKPTRKIIYSNISPLQLQDKALDKAQDQGHEPPNRLSHEPRVRADEIGFFNPDIEDKGYRLVS